jgi:hypothetical protein
MSTEARHLEENRGERRESVGSRMSGWLSSLNGILSSVAGILAAAVAILGLFVHHQAAQLAQAHTTVHEQAQQIKQLQHDPPAPATSPAPAATTTTPGPVATGNIAHYLSDLTPTVNDGSYADNQVVLSGQAYPSSFEFSCYGTQNGDQPDEAFDVSPYTTFTAKVGLPDNEQNVTGTIATVVFTNQDGQQLGKPVNVSLGQSKSVTLNITGVTQLGFTCTGRDEHTNQSANGFQVALGNAGIS